MRPHAQGRGADCSGQGWHGAGFKWWHPGDPWLDPNGLQLLYAFPKTLGSSCPPMPLGSDSSRLPEPGTLSQPPGRVGASPPAMPAKTPTPETVRQEKREQKFTFSHLASFVLS